MEHPPVPFRVVGIENFNVTPIVKGQLYTITGISEDGSRWKTMGPHGKSGWFPSQMCEPVDQPQFQQQRSPHYQEPVPQQARPLKQQVSSPTRTVAPAQPRQVQVQVTTTVSPKQAAPQQATPQQATRAPTYTTTNTYSNIDTTDLLDSLEVKGWDDF